MQLFIWTEIENVLLGVPFWTDKLIKIMIMLRTLFLEMVIFNSIYFLQLYNLTEYKAIIYLRILAYFA